MPSFRSPLVAVVLVLTALFAVPIAAQHACIRTVQLSPDADAVVADGVSSGSCAADPLWAEVSPGAFQPDGMAVHASLYLALNPSADELYVGIAVGGDEYLADQDYLILFFDHDNDDAWSSGDYAVRVLATADPTPVSSGVSCEIDAGPVTVYVHDGSAFVADNALSADVTARTAYDFDTADDTEDEVWNMELVLDLSGALDLPTTGDAFGLGAFTFVDTDATPTVVRQVRHWPGTVTATPPGDVDDPNFIGLDAGELADVDVSGVCFDVNFTAADPWVINGQAASNGDYHIEPGEDNTFTVTFFYDGPGTGNDPQPNEGTVTLALTPYGNIPSESRIAWEKEQEVTADPTNETAEAVFEFDFGSFPPEWSGIAEQDVEFVCADMNLVDFQRDDDDTNNNYHVNVNYLQTSEYAQTAYLLAEEIPGVADGEETEILLQAEMRNERPSRRRGGLMRGGLGGGWGLPATGAAWAMLVAGALLLLVMLRAGPAHVGRPWRIGLVAVALVLAASACRTLPGGGGDPDEARWTFENADELGLRPVEGEPGWYRMPIRVGRPVPLELRFEGRALPYEPERARLEGGGEQMRLRRAVEPGQVLTVVATGLVDPDGPDGPLPRINANGVPGRRSDDARRTDRALAVPTARPGALVGSFDGFETAFTVGTAQALVVPPGAGQLELAVNAPAVESVGAFELYLIDRPPVRVPTATRLRGDGTFSQPSVVPIYEVLTSLNLYTYYETTVPTENGQVAVTRHPIGFSHYALYASHAD